MVLSRPPSAPRRRGPRRVHRVEEGEELVTVLRGLVDEGVGVIGIADGDGSVGCAGGVAAEAGRVL